MVFGMAGDFSSLRPQLFFVVELIEQPAIAFLAAKLHINRTR
jgi:hypothetical protein